MLGVKNISYKYNDKYVFEKFNFRVLEGKTTSIIGKNGVGKSTLVQILAGILPIEAGKILNDSIDQTYLLLQNPQSQTIRGNVYDEISFGLANLGYSLPEIDQKIREVLEEMGLRHLIDRGMETLSGGERQQINLASIIVMDPQVLILDEALSMVSLSTKRRMLKFLERRSSTMTIIHVSHDDEIIFKSDNIIELGTNEVLFNGSVEEYLQLSNKNISEYFIRDLQDKLSEKGVQDEDILFKIEKEIIKLTDKKGATS